MSRKQKKSLLRIIVGAVLLALCLALPLSGIWKLVAFLTAYLVSGGDVLWRAVRNIFPVSYTHLDVYKRQPLL